MDPDPEAPVVLRLDRITKRFGAVLANDAISLTLGAGEAIALLGENGAGKTTLMNVLFGKYAADSGVVEVFGRPLPPGRPGAALAAGVGMVHQHFALADDLSVLENITLGTRPLWRPGRAFSDARARIAALSRDFGLGVRPDARVSTLTVGERQRVEILKALYRDARILILDEPTAVLTPQEGEALFATIRRAVAKGLSVIFISHKLDEVMALASRVVVLRHGRLVGETRTDRTDKHRLAEMMVGSEIAPPRVATAAPGPVLLGLRGLRTPDAAGAPGLKGVDLDLRAGEITGLAGVSGNGQAAIAGIIAGLARAVSGTLELDGAPARGWSPRAALAAGVARIPEDRNAVGVIADMSVAENAVSEAYRAPPFSRSGSMDWRARRGLRRGHRDTLRRALFRRRRAGRGSCCGGNVQKLILGRALEASPRSSSPTSRRAGSTLARLAYVQSRLLEAPPGRCGGPVDLPGP